ncbi:hypothetical protein C470_15123 [Halorubrum distributum JCM 13561]|uniref:DUF4382 domain-containing protein n=1 Tax=Halorubrum distributum JCM 13561 TaxID=1227483 RepID=M0NKG7_9EURY|nr:DUF4382 domain-containing protein [Halorubrum litoreum]EMA57609.1 hypothetical protein C470_15123 [Halorubrum litoreum JCM 13561]
MTDRTSDRIALDRRTYLQATGAAALGAAGLAGCVGRATGTLATQVTDQPADIGDFESLVVTVEGFWLGPEGAEPDDDEDTAGNETDTDGGGDDADSADSDDGSADSGNETDAGDETDGEEDAGREYFEFDEPQEADLVELQNGETKLIDERELQTGEYPYLQLDVSSADGTLTDGSDATVDLPGNAPLKFNEAFEIRENARTTFTADFAPVLRGNGRYLLRPVPSGIEVEYEESTDSEGDESSGDNETDGS